MNYDDIYFELNGLKKEKLIKDFIFTDISNVHLLEFTITTLEEYELKIEYSLNECYKLTNGEIYESFEQILNKHSSEYKKQFLKIISDKMLLLNQNAEQDENN